MPRPSTPSNRPRALELLGSACSRCGYKEDLRVLQFTRAGGTAEAIRRSVSKERYYLRIIQETTAAQSSNLLWDEKLHVPGPWRLLCLNCKFIEMYNTALASSVGATSATSTAEPKAPLALEVATPTSKAGAVAAPATSPFVWRTDLTLPELRNKSFAWLDTLERQGRKVYIALNEGAGAVHCYGTLAQVAPSLEIFEETGYAASAA